MLCPHEISASLEEKGEEENIGKMTRSDWTSLQSLLLIRGLHLCYTYEPMVSETQA